MLVEAIHPRDLARNDESRWRLFQTMDAQLTSPYLSPDWARLVGQTRDDARVAIFRDESSRQAIGFLPVQRPNMFAAMPLGGPVCDYQTFICAPGTWLDIPKALRALRVGRIDFTFALAEAHTTADRVHSPDSGHVIQFPDGWETFEQKSRAKSQTLKRVKKKSRKFEKDVGQLTFESFARDDAAFEQLMHWKAEQHERTGTTNVISTPWIREIIDRSYRCEDSHFGGALFTLKAGDDLAAALYCLRGGQYLHAWYVAHNPAYETYSPGLLIFVEAVRSAANAGFVEMDLGAGSYRFKASLSTYHRPCGPAYVGGWSASSLFRGAQFLIRDQLEALPLGMVSRLPGKAMRRFDIWRGLAPSK